MSVRGQETSFSGCDTDKEQGMPLNAKRLDDGRRAFVMYGSYFDQEDDLTSADTRADDFDSTLFSFDDFDNMEATSEDDLLPPSLTFCFDDADSEETFEPKLEATRQALRQAPYLNEAVLAQHNREITQKADDSYVEEVGAMSLPEFLALCRSVPQGLTLAQAWMRRKEWCEDIIRRITTWVGSCETRSQATATVCSEDVPNMSNVMADEVFMAHADSLFDRAAFLELPERAVPPPRRTPVERHVL